MEIKAKVYKKDLDWLKGIASITIEHKDDKHRYDFKFVIKGIKIINSKNGLFISMPSQKSGNGEYKDICFPINAETRELITNAIMEEYNKEEIDNSEIMVNDDTELPF